MTGIATAIQTQARDVIAKYATFLPQTSLVSANQGDLSAIIAPLLNPNYGVSRFIEGGTFNFFDGLGEEQLTIATVSVDGTHITFAPSSGTGFTGLTATHASGTPVYTNIFDTLPTSEAEKMLALGDPVVFVECAKGTIPMGPWLNALYEPYYAVTVQVELPISKPEDDAFTYDAAMFARRSQQRVKDAIDEIVAILTNHQNLATDFAPALAEQFSQLNGRGDVATIEYETSPAYGGNGYHFCASAQFIIAANAIRGAI